MLRLILVFALLFLTFSGVIGCSEEEVKVGPPLVKKHGTTEAGKVTNAATATSVSGGPTFDKTLSSFVPAGFSLYASAADLSSLKDHLTHGPFDKEQLHLLRASMPTSLSTGLASVVTELNEIAISNKLANSSVLELCLGGFVFAAAPDVEKGSARFLFVANRTGAMVSLFDKFLPAQRDGKKHELANKQVVRETLLRGGSSLFSCTNGAFQIVASDKDVLMAALKAAEGKVPGMAKAPLLVALKPRLDKSARAYMIADLPALVGHKPAFPSVPGAVVKFSGPPPKAPSVLAQLGGLALELVEGRKSLVLNAKVIEAPGGKFFQTLTSYGATENVIGPQIIGESVPFCLGLLTDVEKLFSFSPLASLPPSPMTSAVGNMSARAEVMAKEYSLSFEKDIKPWIGKEISLLFLWELRYPQVALMIGTKDATQCVALFGRLRETLEQKGFIFAKRTVGSHSVYYTRYQGADPREFEPCLTVTPNFLVLATGRRALDALLVEQEKVEGTPGFCSVLQHLKGKLHYCARFSTRLLDRIIEPHERSLTLMTPANHGLCNANLVAVEGGKTHPMLARCPSGGSYSYDGTTAYCSVHGTITDPKVPTLHLKARIRTVKYFRTRFQSIAVGAAKMSDDLYQISIVLQEAPKKDD